MLNALKQTISCCVLHVVKDNSGKWLKMLSSLPKSACGCFSEQGHISTIEEKVKKILLVNINHTVVLLEELHLSEGNVRLGACMF